MPAKVDAGYLVAVLKIQEKAARNLLPILRRVGLIDEEGRPAPLMNEWREDARYPAVCRRMIEELYPEEFRSAFPATDPDRGEIKSWFRYQARTGDGAARQMTSFYLLLCEADAAKEDASAAKPSRNGKKKAASRREASGTVAADEESEGSPTAESQQASPEIPDDTREAHSRSRAVDVCVNVQVVIPETADATMIDAIFASMAKHLRIAE